MDKTVYVKTLHGISYYTPPWTISSKFIVPFVVLNISSEVIHSSDPLALLHVFQFSSKEIKMNKAASVDMPCVSAPVASKKNLFEAGEAWNQTNLKGTPTKVRYQTWALSH